MSFFLKAEVGQDSADAAGADGQPRLANLLSDDISRGVGIKEGVANNLVSNRRGATRRCPGASFAAEQGKATALGEGGENLVIALSGVAVLDGGCCGAESFTFTLDEHSQFAEDLIVAFGWDKSTSGPSDGVSCGSNCIAPPGEGKPGGIVKSIMAVNKSKAVRRDTC